MAGVFAARYPGRCTCCQEPIEAGDLIAYEDEAIVCESCSTGAEAGWLRAEKVCPRCHLVQPCDCEPQPAAVTGPVDPQILRRELLGVIGEAIDDHPRSQQTAIGPSEVGTPCDRRIGYKLLGVPTANHQPPAWRPTVGTAVHAWLEDVFGAWSINHDPTPDKDQPRFLVETRQPVGQINGEDLEGTCDLFDTATGTSIDWKVPGPTTMRKAKAAAARGEIHDPQYRAQAHLYGRGWELKGRQVHTVAVMFLPAAGELADAVFWTEPYQRQIAEDALARVGRIQAIVGGFGERALPILPAADSHCGHCDWFKPGATDLTIACPGAEDLAGARPVRDSVMDLIA